MELGAVIRIRYGQPELSRKFIHLCACSFVVWWRLFDASHWGWRLNVTVPAVMSIRLLYKGAVLKDPYDEDVHTMSRTSSPSELLFGPLQMTLIMVYVGLTKFMTHTGLIIMASFVGDAAAAVVGLHYGRHRYKVAFGGEKSVEGSIGCCLFTMIGIFCYCYMCCLDMIELRPLFVLGITSALVEATALKNWDNFFLCVAMELMSLHLPKMI
jgi:phytol kinase